MPNFEIEILQNLPKMAKIAKNDKIFQIWQKLPKCVKHCQKCAVNGPVDAKKCLYCLPFKNKKRSQAQILRVAGKPLKILGYGWSYFVGN